VKRVLCAVDPSDGSAELLQYANAIVQWYGGCLTALHVVPTSDAAETPRDDRRHAVVGRMRQTIAAAGVSRDRVRYEVESGEPAAMILARAVALRTDTIVVGTRRQRSTDDVRVGSVTDMVLRHARCDVLTVPPSRSSVANDGRVGSIVCGIDFSTRSTDALRATFDLADRMQSRVVLVHAIEWLVEVEPADDLEFDVSDLRTRLVYNAQRRLDAFATNESPLDGAVRTKAAIGRSHRELLSIAAEEHADVIVVGSTGRGGTRLPVLGSTVEQLVRAAACPVLTIRLHHERSSRCS
jgi:nucleotide-binding universal stress UspA family protein